MNSMNLMDMIGEDCENIIYDYVKDIQQHEKNIKNINKICKTINNVVYRQFGGELSFKFDYKHTFF